MHYSYRLLIVLAALLGLSPAMAQDPSDTHQPARHVVVKLAPLSLVDIDATLQGAIEFPILGQTTFQIEGGYGWPGLSRSTEDDGSILTNRQTRRFRAEVRHYIPKTMPLDGYMYPTGLYVAGEALVKVLSADRLQTTVLPCLAAPCPVGTETARVHRTVMGGHIKLGYQTGFGIFRGSRLPGLSRLIFDAYAGIGARHIRVRQVAGPPIITGDGTLRFTRFIPGRSFWAGSLSGGLKLGWAL